ncbi:DNA cytosine methyltransferase [Cereibacter sphaeroides]|nr:DNA cytosine methyltransferase [Cereibacter sphaeroides]AZB69954.1 DNA cytosine methyltransferase [Cereibacter sphaeroides]
MRYLSVCSGIEAATMAWHPLGWQPVAFSEIEPFPCAVLAHHYPTVPNWGDMTRFQDWPDVTVDLLCGGTPCQSFSVAGLRKGLADPRGNLMLTFGAIAGRYRPRWLVWENVPGVLSSNGGRDFGTFLGMLGQLGYGFAYRVLDAQHVRTRRFPFAVPQRRRRVFVVGYLGDWRRAAAVLFDRESLSGHPPPRREAGQRPAPTLSARPSGGGGLGTDFDCDGGLIPSVANCLQTTCDDYSRADGFNMIAHAALPFDTTQITSAANRSKPKPGDPCHPLAAGAHPPAIAFSSKDYGGDAEFDLSPTLRAGAHDGSHANAGVPPAVAFAENSLAEVRLCGGDGSVMSQLTTGGGKPGQGQPTIAMPYLVRRLTPRECERLQGFPPDFTLVPLPLKGRQTRVRWAADGPRYKVLGNSWAVNCADWIGERIAIVDQWAAEEAVA